MESRLVFGSSALWWEMHGGEALPVWSVLFQVVGLLAGALVLGVVIAGVGQAGGILDEDLLRLLVSATLISLFLTPFLVRLAGPAGRRLGALIGRRGGERTETERLAAALRAVLASRPAMAGRPKERETVGAPG